VQAAALQSYQKVANNEAAWKQSVPVVAIGGIGGSGTRLGARLLQMIGFYIGDDLNQPLDNLWFTLLFKRAEALKECDTNFHRRLSLFWRRMSGSIDFSHEERHDLIALSNDDTFGHPSAWLLERAISFVEQSSQRCSNQPWGWKEPNTQLVVDRILRDKKEVKYINFVRHPLDMAFNANQNQLRNWGPTFLQKNVEVNPRSSLNYWCTMHRRINSLVASWPDRILNVNFDALVENPDMFCDQLEGFLSVEVSDENRRVFANLVSPDVPVQSWSKATDLDQFDAQDVEYIRALGYLLPMASPLRRCA
jgi:hypothetical protein